MTIQQLLWQGAQILNKAGVPDEALDSRYLLMEAFHLNLASLLAVKNRELPEDEETLEMRRTYEELIRRRAGRIPLQHLTGVQEFMGFERACADPAPGHGDSGGTGAGGQAR